MIVLLDADGAFFQIGKIRIVVEEGFDGVFLNAVSRAVIPKRLSCLEICKEGVDLCIIINHLSIVATGQVFIGLQE